MDKDFRFTLYNNICEIESDKDNQLVIRFLDKYVTGYEELKEFQRGYSKKVKNPVALYLTVEEDSKVKYLFPRGLWDLIEDKDKLAIKSKFKIEDKSTDEYQLNELTINNFRDKLKSILQPESGFDLREDQVTAIFKALKVKRGLIQYPTGCLVGESKIIMTNDIIKPISEMEKNKEKYVGKRVYSVTKEGHPEFGEIEDIFISRTVDELIKIEFFGVDCKPILCTDNHPFLVGNDIYKEAGKLRKRDLVYSMSFEDIQGIIIRDNSVRVIRRELLKIKSIKRIKLDNPIEVYDMTIKGYNNFTVMVDDNRGAVLHNSGKTEIMSGIIKSLVTKYPDIKLLVLEPTDILVNNTARRFQKYGINALPYKLTRRQINNNVIVSHPMGLLNDLEKEPELLKGINGVFWDECLSKSAKIMLPSGNVMTIESIYENPNIMEVISYNLETNEYEIKKIIRKIRIEHNDFFWRLNYVNPITGKLEWLCATPNHKIWTYNRGYVELQDLTENDYIKIDVSDKVMIYSCKYCGKKFNSSNALGGHTAWCKSSGNYDKSLISLKKSYENGTRVSNLSNSNIFKKAMITRSNNREYCKKISERMLVNNPMHSLDVIEKMKKSLKLFYENNPDLLEKRKINFIKASHSGNKITDLEQFILNLNIPNLKFTGNDSVLTFKNGKHKMPDFTYINGDEVKYIEISNRYWYSAEEINEFVKSYRDSGMEILYLTDADLDDAEMLIKKFLFNHMVKVHSIKKNVGKKGKFRYNLEIEDNHNYFANNILVSNCHHIRSNTWSLLNVCIPNAEYTLGFSALAITKEHRYETNLKKLDIDEVLALGAVSRLLCETTPRYYINKGILACPVVIQFKAWIVKTAMTNNNWQVLRKAILESYERINIGLKAINILVKYNRRCLILVDTKVQAYKIMNQLADKFNLSDKAGLAFGGNIGLRLDKKKYESRRINPEEIESISNQKKKTEIRKRQLEITESCLFNVENITDRFDKNEFNILVATTVADEGLDLDSLDSVLLISAGRKDRRFIQRVGRTIRKSKTGKFGYVLDLNDSGNNILEFHSKERMRIYRDVIEAYDECIYENFDVEQFEYLFKKLEGLEEE